MVTTQNKPTLSRDQFDAVIFDLDGVITQSAKVHAKAWKEVFDAYLSKRGRSEGKTYAPFDKQNDYLTYVDGKPRYEGVKSFLQARGIHLLEGSPEDGPDKESVCGLGNRKNLLFQKYLKQEGIEVYTTSVAWVKALQDAHFKVAVVSSSKNCSAILESAGIRDLFLVQVDGVRAAEQNMIGKPAPDIFLAAARELGVKPERAVIVEDALAGVQAGVQGHFGYIIGVDRAHHAGELKQRGADLVVEDLEEIEVGRTAKTDNLPSALENYADIEKSLKGYELVIFLDYDGTLTPIVAHPEQAYLAESMRQVVRTLAERYRVAIISGRDLSDVQNRVGIESIYYAGSHGFDIAGPGGLKKELPEAKELLLPLRQAENELKVLTQDFQGAQIESKRFSIAIHYRNVVENHKQALKRRVEKLSQNYPGLKLSPGKEVLDLGPDIGWDKGKALLWLLSQFSFKIPSFSIYLGDDLTDEEAFKILGKNGFGIVVRDSARETYAHYALNNPEEVLIFLQRLVRHG